MDLTDPVRPAAGVPNSASKGTGEGHMAMGTWHSSRWGGIFC
jgi:hypothetical protein